MIHREGEVCATQQCTGLTTGDGSGLCAACRRAWNSAVRARNGDDSKFRPCTSFLIETTHGVCEHTHRCVEKGQHDLHKCPCGGNWE